MIKKNPQKFLAILYPVTYLPSGEQLISGHIEDHPCIHVPNTISTQIHCCYSDRYIDNMKYVEEEDINFRYP